MSENLKTKRKSSEKDLLGWANIIITFISTLILTSISAYIGYQSSQSEQALTKEIERVNQEIQKQALEQDIKEADLDFRLRITERAIDSIRFTPKDKSAYKNESKILISLVKQMEVDEFSNILLSILKDNDEVRKQAEDELLRRGVEETIDQESYNKIMFKSLNSGKNWIFKASNNETKEYTDFDIFIYIKFEIDKKKSELSVNAKENLKNILTAIKNTEKIGQVRLLPRLPRGYSSDTVEQGITLIVKKDHGEAKEAERIKSKFKEVGIENISFDYNGTGDWMVSIIVNL